MATRLLGGLEQRVMDIVWRSGGSSIKGVFDDIRKKKSIAYTTVATVLQRLFTKGLVKRKMQKDGNWFFYPKISKESYIKTLSKSFINALVESFGDVAVSSFAKGIGSLPKEKRHSLLKILSQHES